MGAYLMERMADWPAALPDCRRRARTRADDRRSRSCTTRTTKERAPELRDRLEQMAFERGLLVLGAGQNSIRLCPAAGHQSRPGRFRRRYAGGLPNSAAYTDSAKETPPPMNADLRR